MMCGKCSRMGAWVMLVLGVVFLLNSMGIFFDFRASEFGIVLTVFGLLALFGLECPDCQKGGRRKR